MKLFRNVPCGQNETGDDLARRIYFAKLEQHPFRHRLVGHGLDYGPLIGGQEFQSWRFHRPPMCRSISMSLKG
jgi:hypothetical protein